MNTQLDLGIKNAVLKKQLTNLYVYEILIKNFLVTIDNYIGLTSSEIGKIANEEMKRGRYVKNYYESYVNRKVRPEQIGLANSRYFILECDRDVNKLRQHLDYISKKIDEPNPIQSKINGIKSILSWNNLLIHIKNSIKNGDANDFEVLSYSILKIFFRSFGFNLLRFSSTNANDGGADFIGGDTIYCVTTQLNLKKLDTDVEKTHAPKVFIHRNLIDNKTELQIKSYMQSESEIESITNVLSASEIIDFYLNQLENIFNRNPNIYINLMNTIIGEYEKELV